MAGWVPTLNQNKVTLGSNSDIRLHAARDSVKNLSSEAKDNEG